MTAVLASLGMDARSMCEKARQYQYQAQLAQAAYIQSLSPLLEAYDHVRKSPCGQRGWSLVSIEGEHIRLLHDCDERNCPYDDYDEESDGHVPKDDISDKLYVGRYHEIDVSLTELLEEVA